MTSGGSVKHYSSKSPNDRQEGSMLRLLLWFPYFADKQYRLDALEGNNHMRLVPLPC